MTRAAYALPPIHEHVPLREKTWFRVGGPARWYCEPQNNAEFAGAAAWAQEQGVPIFVLGNGANLLVSDAGFAGLVIAPKNRTLEIRAGDDGEHASVTAGAGVTIDDLISYCLNNNLLGLEEFSGIPGTVGGSVFINLHYFSFRLSQFLVSGRVIDVKSGEIMPVENSWFNFGYDYSTLHEQKHLLLDATFRVKRATDLETAFARGRQTEIIRHRRQRYPYQNTCGSFFRNFHEDEVTIVSNGKKMIFIAYYLDKLGIKGVLAVGDALVSHQHANMIVNRGNATAQDIVELARKMQELVRDNFGIVPQAECQFVGFEKHPLL
ncbi:MAG: UDP-N-acetylmuramate dehydrogenase [Candidatus Dependentiae bacterium]|nr:UDP-N-acetylmuramate dehydrogenase [Candidatus Dependentiae bacterium]